jgi:murein DD-endopeptidase MepM/ murein hydrolase activator NlpD
MVGYGNSVVLDHGCGLFSMYAHLSLIDVEAGVVVDKGDILGRTGSTGMAGGDHLHFAMIVQGVFVNPVEWWDPHWIQDNIALKLE